MSDSVIIKKFLESSDYKKMEERISKYSVEEWEAIKAQYEEIIGTMLELKLMEVSPASDEMQEMVHIWRTHITNFYYVCDRARLRAFYNLYKNETNYKKQLEQTEKGFADYIADAIDFYLKNN